jgi:hypothetical protein
MLRKTMAKNAILDAVIEFIDEEVMSKIKKLEDRIEDLELELVTERKIDRGE